MSGSFDLLECMPTGCPRTFASERGTAGKVRVLVERLRTTLKSQGTERSLSEIKRLAACLVWCKKRAEEKRHLFRQAANQPKTDILFWIASAKRNGDLDELLWRCFLAGHFGRMSASPEKPEQVQSAGRFLCAFGTRPRWTWKAVSADMRGLRSWLLQNKKALKTLRFGNHRKFESKEPEALFRAVQSFADWVRSSSGTPRKALYVVESGPPEDSFDSVYRRVGRGIWRMGRTGAFDLLCLLGDCRALPVRPGSCCLGGSTGPLNGARKFWGKLPPSVLARLADEAARQMRIAYDIFEDALCTWQK